MVSYSVLGALVAIQIFLGTALAEKQNRVSETKQTEPPQAGLWLPDAVIENMLDTLAEESADGFRLDENQTLLMKGTLKKHLVPFLHENRAEIMDLTNLFLECSFDNRPPTTEEAANWAKRMAVLLDVFKERIDLIVEDMSKYVTESQLPHIELARDSLNMGFSLLQLRLHNMANGGFDPDIDWPKGKHFDKSERERSIEEAKMHRALYEEYLTKIRNLKKDPADEAWEREVKVFIVQYKLNDDQTTKAYSFLKNALEQRDAYYSRTNTQFETLRTKAEENRTEEIKARFVKECQSREKVVERIHTVLTERLHKLPTPKQKKAVAETKEAHSVQKNVPASSPSE